MGPIYKAALAVGVAGVLAAGCTASGADVSPARDQFFFPTGAAISPDGTKLFIANANSDLRFDSGAVFVLSLPTVETTIAQWLASERKTVPAGCQRDSSFSETLVCDEGNFLAETAGAGVRIGNFATDIALQELKNGRLRVLVPTRGDPSITWADWDGQRLSCNRSGQEFDLCEDANRLSFVLNDADETAIPTEPFGAYADSASEFAIVTHLTTGTISLIDSPTEPLFPGESRDPNNPNDKRRPVQVTDISSGMFLADPATGRPSATSVAGRTPHAAGDIVYVGSRTDDRIQTFTVGHPNDKTVDPPYLLTGEWFHLDQVGTDSNPNGGSNDTRGMAFSKTGDRLYLLNRKPPSVQVIDTSLGPTGVPKNTLLGASDICRQASTVSVIDSGDGERAYVTCFQDGQVYVINPNGRVHVEDIITVGRGPYAVVASPDGKRLYVTNFLEDSLAVVDLVPGSPTRFRVVMRLGLRTDEQGTL